MNDKRQVFIAVNCPLYRRMLQEIFTSTADMQTCGFALTLNMGMHEVERLQPDLLIVQTLPNSQLQRREIQSFCRLNPRTPVILVGSHDVVWLADKRSSLVGQVGFVRLPPKRGMMTDALANLAEHLLPIARRLSAKYEADSPHSAVPDASSWTLTAPLIEPPNFVETRCVTHGIGVFVSAKSSAAFVQLLRDLPGDLPFALLVDHDLPASLADILFMRVQQFEHLTIRTGYAGAPIRAGEVWLAPPGRRLAIDDRDDRLALSLETAPSDLARHCDSESTFFATLARHFAQDTVALILGAAQDEVWAGCQHVQAAGGCVLHCGRRPADLELDEDAHCADIYQVCSRLIGILTAPQVAI